MNPANDTDTIRYRVQPDEVVSARTPTGLVTILARTSREPVRDNQHFRERAAHWAGAMWNKTVRTENDDVFVADMISAGLYKVER